MKNLYLNLNEMKNTVNIDNFKYVHNVLEKINHEYPMKIHIID